MGTVLALMQISNAALAILLVFGALPARSEIVWDTFVEPERGTRVDFPSGIFASVDGPSQKGLGQMFSTTDGRAVLAIYSQRNEGETPPRYVRENFKVPRKTIDYKRVTRTFFAISAVHEGDIYYSRCNFSRGSGSGIHCFDLKYPRREKRAWDRIVTRISRSLRPLERE